MDHLLLAGLQSAFFIFLLVIVPSGALDPFDPAGNITIKWDVLNWNGDGYVAMVTIYNYQQYRHIESPGWTLGWRWAKEEVIWNMQGAQATMQGDCSRLKNAQSLPHSCKKDPVIIDLMPGVPYSQQSANCCRGGVISSYAQDPAASVASFQLTVGRAHSDVKTVNLPQQFTFGTPGPGYTCSQAKLVTPSLFPSPDGRRKSQALMTWTLACMYSQPLAQRAPTCCVSFSSFYNPKIIPCQKCSCDCSTNVARSQPFKSHTPMCIESEDVLELPSKNTVNNSSINISNHSNGLYCTQDMCPIKIHWHVQTNYKEYWRAKLTITNRHLRNYTHWNMIVQHPNFNKLTNSFSFITKSLTPYQGIYDTNMFWGIKYYNDILLQAGRDGAVQSELLFEKDSSTFTFSQGWAFPQRILFNGDMCVLPPPDSYPTLPNAAHHHHHHHHHHQLILSFFLTFTFIFLI